MIIMGRLNIVYFVKTEKLLLKVKQKLVEITSKSSINCELILIFHFNPNREI